MFALMQKGEPMDDLISRKAMREAMYHEAMEKDSDEQKWDGGCWIRYKMFERVVESIPSEPQWIPCESKLPEDYTDVLAWFEYFRYGDYNCLYQTYGIGSYSMEHDSWMINHETGWHKLRVIAWMPLPEPMKENRNDERGCNKNH